MECRIYVVQCRVWGMHREVQSCTGSLKCILISGGVELHGQLQCILISGGVELHGQLQCILISTIYTVQVQCIYLFRTNGIKPRNNIRGICKSLAKYNEVLATSRCSVAGHSHIYTVEQRATLMEIIRLQKHSFYILPQFSLHLCLPAAYIQRTLYIIHTFL